MTGLLVVGAAGFYVYHLPEVNVLFQSETRPARPLDFLENLPEPEVRKPTPRPRAERRSAPQPQSPPSAPEAPSVDNIQPAGENQVPNGEVGRILMQILAAKKLASGLSMSVTDTEIALHGTVESRDTLKRILEVVEKGREYRAINLDNLTVE